MGDRDGEMGWEGGRWDEMRDGERGDGGVMEEGVRDGTGDRR